MLVSFLANFCLGVGTLVTVDWLFRNVFKIDNDMVVTIVAAILLFLVF